VSVLRVLESRTHFQGQAKVKDLTFEAKAKNMMYDGKSKALQKLYLGLGHIASNHYKIVQKAMSFSQYVSCT